MRYELMLKLLRLADKSGPDAEVLEQVLAGMEQDELARLETQIKGLLGALVARNQPED